MSPLWSRVPASVRTVVSQIPQSRLAIRIARSLTPNRLRILAFHGVPDLHQFELLLDEILSHYTAVSEDEVVASIEGDLELPRLAAWFTFDDGLPSTLAAGPALARRGIRATAFVCPSVLDTAEPLWFQTWEQAESEGLLETPEFQAELSLSRMKTMPDHDRRKATEDLIQRLGSRGVGEFEQASQAMLTDWVKVGHYVGNHTWDHPLLDQCSPPSQREQVTRAHADLVGRGFCPRFLAYPNGNVAQGSVEAARELGYVGSVLFDHRLARIGSGDTHHLSRLRIDSDADTRRTSSILSGAHSAMLHLAL